jgi:hypothetical protein
MCKLLIITGALRKEIVEKVLVAANAEFAKTERDGFGFIAVAGGGKYARGRYFEPDRFRGFGLGLPHFITGDIAEENQIPACAKTLIVHGRTATTAKNLENVHPFMHGQEALAHNGVVDWLGPEDQRPPKDCDSEQFFKWLRYSSWEESHQAFAGWGAIAHVDIKTGILTIARDGAELYIAKRRDSAGWVMATRAAHLVAICKAAGIRLQHSPLLVPNNKLLLFSRRGAVTKAMDWGGFGQRTLTYRDALSWGIDNDDDERLPESTGQKRRSHGRRARRRKDHRSHPSLWERSDSGECGEE